MGVRWSRLDRKPDVIGDIKDKYDRSIGSEGLDYIKLLDEGISASVFAHILLGQTVMN